MSSNPFSLSVKVLIHDEQGRCLVLRRSSASSHNAMKWDFPGGKTDPGESLDAAARRETLEETGLEIELTRVAGAGESESNKNRIAYLFLEARIVRGKIRLSSEHDAYAWLSPDELASADLCPQFHEFVRSLT